MVSRSCIDLSRNYAVAESRLHSLSTRHMFAVSKRSVPPPSPAAAPVVQHAARTQSVGQVSPPLPLGRRRCRVAADSACVRAPAGRALRTCVRQVSWRVRGGGAGGGGEGWRRRRRVRCGGTGLDLAGPRRSWLDRGGAGWIWLDRGGAGWTEGSWLDRGGAGWTWLDRGGTGWIWLNRGGAGWTEGSCLDRGELAGPRGAGWTEGSWLDRGELAGSGWTEGKPAGPRGSWLGRGGAGWAEGELAGSGWTEGSWLGRLQRRGVWCVCYPDIQVHRHLYTEVYARYLGIG